MAVDGLHRGHVLPGDDDHEPQRARLRHHDVEAADHVVARLVEHHDVGRRRAGLPGLDDLAPPALQPEPRRPAHHHLHQPDDDAPAVAHLLGRLLQGRQQHDQNAPVQHHVVDVDLAEIGAEYVPVAIRERAQRPGELHAQIAVLLAALHALGHARERLLQRKPRQRVEEAPQRQKRGARQLAALRPQIEFDQPRPPAQPGPLGGAEILHPPRRRRGPVRVTVPVRVLGEHAAAKRQMVADRLHVERELAAVAQLAQRHHQRGGERHRPAAPHAARRRPRIAHQRGEQVDELIGRALRERVDRVGLHRRPARGRVRIAARIGEVQHPHVVLAPEALAQRPHPGVELGRPLAVDEEKARGPHQRLRRHAEQKLGVVRGDMPLDHVEPVGALDPDAGHLDRRRLGQDVDDAQTRPRIRRRRPGHRAGAVERHGDVEPPVAAQPCGRRAAERPGDLLEGRRVGGGQPAQAQPVRPRLHVRGRVADPPRHKPDPLVRRADRRGHVVQRREPLAGGAPGVRLRQPPRGRGAAKRRRERNRQVDVAAMDPEQDPDVARLHDAPPGLDPRTGAAARRRADAHAPQMVRRAESLAPVGEADPHGAHRALGVDGDHPRGAAAGMADRVAGAQVAIRHPALRRQHRRVERQSLARSGGADEEAMAAGVGIADPQLLRRRDVAPQMQNAARRGEAAAIQKRIAVIQPLPAFRRPKRQRAAVPRRPQPVGDPGRNRQHEARRNNQHERRAAQQGERDRIRPGERLAQPRARPAHRSAQKPPVDRLRRIRRQSRIPRVCCHCGALPGFGSQSALSVARMSASTIAARLASSRRR